MTEEKPTATNIILRLGWVSLLNDLGSEVLIRLTPIYLTTLLGAPMSVVGAIEGVAESTATLLKPLFGTWSDRLGKRKPFVVWGYALSALARPLLALTGSWQEVAFLRFCDRSGKGVRTAPRDALIADASRTSRDHGRNFGLNRAMDTCGAVLSVAAFAGWVWYQGDSELTARSWTVLTLLCGVPGIAALILVARSVSDFSEPVIQAQLGSTQALPKVIHPPLPASFRRYLAVVLVFSLANSSDAFILLRAKQAGYSLLQILGFVALLNLVSAMTSIPAAALSDRFGRRTLIALGWSIYALVYLALGTEIFTQNGLLLALVLSIYGLFYGFTDSVERAWIADLVPATARGKAYGTFGLAVGVSALPASLGFGWAWDQWGATVPFWGGAALAFFAVGLLFTFGPGNNKSS